MDRFDQEGRLERSSQGGCSGKGWFEKYGGGVGVVRKRAH